jgi:hypothetical protein
VLRYLAGTTDVGITYGGATQQLEGYSDADYAGDVDDRKSTLGYVFTLHGGTVSWRSNKQKSVATSTAEAELVATAEATKEALFLRMLMRDLERPVDTIPMHTDNQACLSMIETGQTSSRTKHINVADRFAHSAQSEGKVHYSYLRTEEMVADFLTKTLPLPKHQACMKWCGMA